MSRVLLLEDEAALRALLIEALEEEGHEVLSSGDGRAALDPALTAAADVMITDLMMPGCDGLEAIVAARAANPALRIIAMSGGGRTVTTDFLPMALELGADMILSKPFRPGRLTEAVAELAGRVDRSALRA